jgi:predicted RND superfamily exporter protein
MLQIKEFIKNNILFNPLALAIASILVIAALLRLVDLQPHVDNEFFFSGDSKQFKTEEKIAAMFPVNSQIIISAKGEIYSPRYLRRVKCMTKDLAALQHVTGVKSLVDGPGSIDMAVKGPLWNRLLLSNDKKASNIIVFIDSAESPQIIPRVERIASYYSAPGFEIKIAGFSFIVELIRRNLVRDLSVFSGSAFIIFGLMMMVLFRSFKVVVGAMVTCLDACILTLVISQLLQVKIGILTANLFTIVFVVTLSHLVFITNNWYHFKTTTCPDSRQAAWEAMKATAQGSFWCMVTTSLGFASLIFVEAKPLKELGISGSVGTLVALFASYAIYPLFLGSVKETFKSTLHQYEKKRLFVGHYMWATVFFAFIAGFCFTGIKKLNTDPSLLVYFKQGSELRQGLEYIDSNGGSSPLNLVVSDFYGAKLNTNEAYKRLWALQDSLEKDSDVGSTLSLPVLIAESKQNPLANFVSLETLLRILEDSKYDRVASTFVTKDREHVHFFMRMREDGRKVPRLQVVERIKDAAVRQKLKVDFVGGVYVLQGELSKLIASSMIDGLLQLGLLFVGIAYIVSRSVKVTFAMIVCLAILPICILGATGHLGIPLDTISAPAANVAIGMGIDSMIHMVIMMRRFLKQDKNSNFWAAWKQARIYLWQPVVSSMVIICSGFGIFAFSMFPPNQRFGLEVVFGSLIAAPIALFVLPSVVGPWFYKE